MICGCGNNGKDRIGWLEHTLGEISASIERAVFTEEHARADGWLQRVDPRVKLGMFLAVVLAAGLSHSFIVLTALYALVLAAGVASRLPLDFFVKRVWLGMPLFAGAVMVPAIFLTPGPHVFALRLGSFEIGPTIPGLIGAVIFITRVAVSVSVAVLLVLTTPWADVLKSLQALKVPQVFILTLSMSYRYIFLFLHTVNGTLQARQSRTVGRTSGREQRRWISGNVGALMHRSFKTSNDVYSAMLARGFTGEVRTHSRFHVRPADWAALAATLSISSLTLLATRYLG